MKKIIFVVIICLVMVITPAFAHHPAADIVSEQVYEAIEDAVSSTPHADMVFEDMGTIAVDMPEPTKITIIYFKSLGTKTNMLVMFILNHASLLEGDVDISIEYDEEDAEVPAENNKGSLGSTNTWNEWGRPFYLTITQIMPEDFQVR